MNDIYKKDKLIYAVVAPAFIGQFLHITPGKLRSAFKALGCDGMIEVSLFADILTLKESLEFVKNIDEKKFMLTSCCCPMWIAMLRKENLLSHVPGSVSPMIATGRVIKKIHKDAIVFFVGPCIAKKAEAREKDLVGAVDYVLTFQEIKFIFDKLNINPIEMQEINRDHSSHAGRIYARAGGVSEAVRLTVNRLNNKKKIVTEQSDGVVNCKKLIEKIKDYCNNNSNNDCANFFEGMGCSGGCVGGPKRIIDKENAREYVNEYADKANYLTPIDNPYVIKLLKILGFETIESLIEDKSLFTRNFISN
jgi:iron only hydrogenase large subunit-like protein